MATARYTVGAELPDLAVTWLAADGSTIIDFSSGYTFEVKVGQPGAAASFTKVAGITGAATAPNLTIAWATAAELSTLAAGGYDLQIKATRTADGKDRLMSVKLALDPAVT